MKFLVQDDTGHTTSVVLAVSEWVVLRMTRYLAECGGAVEPCLVFQEMLLEDGRKLSDSVFELGRSLQGSKEENTGTSGGEEGFTSEAPSDGEHPKFRPRPKRGALPPHDEHPASLADRTTGEARRPIWVVVGGMEQGGISVREDRSTSSPLLAERLSRGAQIEELETSGGRMKYRLTSGIGPSMGWISPTVRGKILVTKMIADPSGIRPSAAPRIALIFPGEGCQYKGMINDFKDPVIMSMLDRAKVILGYDVGELCASGPEIMLSRTKYGAPALYITSLAALQMLRAKRPEVVANASVMAGYGLGYYTALCAAGVLTFEEGLWLVKTRAEAMERVCDIRQHGLAVIAGLDEGTLRQHCQKAAIMAGPGAVCEIAQSNFPKCYSVGGALAALHIVRELAMESGAVMIRYSNTGVASECSVMGPALPELSMALAQATRSMKPPSCSLWTTTKPARLPVGTSVTDIVADLKGHLTQPILWASTVRGMIDEGVNEFYELGPQKFLRSMIYRIDRPRTFKVHNVEARLKHKKV